MLGEATKKEKGILAVHFASSSTAGPEEEKKEKRKKRKDQQNELTLLS